MQEEVRDLLTQLYPVMGEEPPGPAATEVFSPELLSQGVLFLGEPPWEFVREASRRKPGSRVIADLTELNERSFTSGISSRTA